ncbi:hypothetical protein E6H31_07855 [Candidatus Bathyarchaeota archaeon]|nr:MAG: hypothetical protein E6H31_07855 [Candidatus Bathyarchaeota archaeon]
MHDILLLLSRSNITKTQAIYLTNTNSILMARYLSFLIRGGYLAREFRGMTEHYIITPEGTHFLSLLIDVERAMRTFRYRLTS